VSPGAVTISTEADFVDREEVVEVALVETTPVGDNQVMSARLVPSPNGSISWSNSTLVQGSSGNMLKLTYRLCPSGGSCASDAVTLATYRYPAANPDKELG
jgi:hypothetical protein